MYISTRISMGILLGCFLTTAQAINWNGYREAKALEKEKRYDEAIAIYEKLKDNGTDEKDDQQYMEWAVDVALKKKDPAEARRLAERIKNPARRNYVLMRLLKPEEITAQYGDIDLMSWPEDIRATALYRRGLAYNAQKNYEHALNNFLAAEKTPGGIAAYRIGIPYHCATVYRKWKKDDVKAEEFYRKALAASSADFATRCNAVIELSAMLVEQKRMNEALQLFEPVERLEKPNTHFFVRMNHAYADTLKAAGKKVEAIKVLERLLNAVPEAQKASYQKQIEQLSDEIL